MGLVLWIDHNTFASSLIERAFKKRALPFYTINNVDDFSYLVDDLQPALIVLDSATYSQNASRFQEQYQASAGMQSIPFIIIDAQVDFSFLKNRIGDLKRPFDPFLLPDLVEKMMKTN